MDRTNFETNISNTDPCNITDKTCGMRERGKSEKRLSKIRILATVTIFCLGLLTCCGQQEEPTAVRIGGLKGPTSMGLVFLQEQAQSEQAEQEYEFTMAVGADPRLL